MQCDAPWRVGQGFDVHAFAENRPLILGGVTIEHPLGLLGHSDADVLAHAIMDALLGAALLAFVTRLLEDRGWGIVNVDATVIAQKPRLAPHIPAMTERLAAAMGVTPEVVNVKATTSERLGFTGRGEGIAAMATALIGRTS